ncbi:MAG: DUF1697 domain-containing protein [Acidimicrobiia bacterium]
MSDDSTRHIGFVRNVMIGREGLHRQVLLDLFSNAGAEAPRSYISTGNISFSAPDTELPGLIASVEEGIAGVIGRSEEVFVRRIRSLEQLVASDPFAGSPYPDTVERTVSFVPHGTDLGALALPIESQSGRVCVFAATEHEILSAGRSLGGRTQGAGGFVERTLGCRVTSRAWSTVTRIVDNPC